MWLSRKPGTARVVQAGALANTGFSRGQCCRCFNGHTAMPGPVSNR